MDSPFYVLCAHATASVATVTQRVAPQTLQVKYLFQKTECVETYVLHEYFPEQHVNLYVPFSAAAPCTLLLPKPFHNTLKRGSTLLFEMLDGHEFVTMWNSCCQASVSWQHNRPKKTDDPFQKLGLPARLSEHLRQQVEAHGHIVPQGSDEESVVTGLTAGVGAEEQESSYSTTSQSSEFSDSEEYYSQDDLVDDGNGDMEEEEVEDEGEDLEEPDDMQE